jgi:hypothetical protein
MRTFTNSAANRETGLRPETVGSLGDKGEGSGLGAPILPTVFREDDESQRRHPGSPNKQATRCITWAFERGSCRYTICESRAYKEPAMGHVWRVGGPYCRYMEP